jgi:2-keto-4-pentenoate hydratase/2-oxohepta-3-ene-1,7-dioic acid hydratase in catechol pathway
MFSPKDRGLERGWPGRIEGDRVVQLAAQTLQSFFTGGGRAREHAEYRLDEIEFRAPVLHPPTVRDFSAFRRDDLAFYFSNPTAIFGPEDEIPYPEGVEELDCEAEVAAVIGADGGIGGFTLMNDWTARDVLRGELAGGLGPVKSKDFATSLGPVLLTPDAFDGASGEMVVRINGEERSRDDVGGIRRTWDELVAHAARNTRLLPGDVIGSGGVDVDRDGARLRPGDVVELELAGVGVLRNRVGQRL